MTKIFILHDYWEELCNLETRVLDEIKARMGIIGDISIDDGILEVFIFDNWTRLGVNAISHDAWFTHEDGRTHLNRFKDMVTIEDLISLVVELRDYMDKMEVGTGFVDGRHVLTHNRKNYPTPLSGIEVQRLADSLNHQIRDEMRKANKDKECIWAEIKSDGDRLGIILDFWTLGEGENYRTGCYWFEDFQL